MVQRRLLSTAGMHLGKRTRAVGSNDAYERPSPTCTCSGSSASADARACSTSRVAKSWSVNPFPIRVWICSRARAAAGIGTGLITFFSPGITALALTYLIAAWAIVTGVTKVANAIRLRKQIKREGLLILSGLVSIVFGVLVAMMPLPGIVGIMWAVGFFGVVFGTLELVLSARLRRAGERPEAAEEEQAPPRAA